MDALSHVLTSIRVEGAVYLNAEFTAPWCVRSTFGLANVSSRLASENDLLFFHYVTEGGCKLRVANGDVLEASAGDLILFSCDERHVMGTDLKLAPVEAASITPTDITPQGDLIQVRHGGGGEATRIVCGYIACNRIICSPLVDALPPVLCLKVGDGLASSLLREVLRAAVTESFAAKPGADLMLTKLSELIFAEAMRRYVSTLSPRRTGWLAGIKDAKVGRVLGMMHSKPERAWTVDDFAGMVGLSRSGFAKRFTDLVGHSPMQYLTRWRLAVAAHLLRTTTMPIARIAQRSGYDSEAAFNRAFKREFGQPPAAWRRAGAVFEDADQRPLSAPTSHALEGTQTPPGLM